MQQSRLVDTGCQRFFTAVRLGVGCLFHLPRYLQQLPVSEYLPELQESLDFLSWGPKILQEALGNSGLVTCSLFCSLAALVAGLTGCMLAYWLFDTDFECFRCSGLKYQ